MTGRSLWVSVAAADRVPAAAREAIAGWATQVVRVRPDTVALITCHRVELYGAGDPPDRSFGWAGATGWTDAPLLLRDDPALRHLFRLAAGLESAVVGEDQVLHQLRVAFADALRVADPDLEVVRAFEIGLRIGRRARAGLRAGRVDIGSLAVAWLDRTVGSLANRTLLVAGAGAMGRAVAASAGRRGARIVVASRTLAHAQRLAADVDGSAVDLVSAAGLVERADALAIALGGPWVALGRAGRLPATVDLSFPAVVTAAQQASLGDRFAGVDTLFGLGRNDMGDVGATSATTAEVAAYSARAEVLVAEGIAEFNAWLAGRRSVETLRRLRERAELRRADDLNRLLRRLPDLAPRERDLVSAFSQQLVAGLLHDPMSVLRDDVDGSAAEAARQLFRL